MRYEIWLNVEKKVITTQNEWLNNKSKQKCNAGNPATQIKVERRRRENSSVFEIEGRQIGRNRGIAEKNQRWEIKRDSKIERIARKGIRSASRVRCIESQKSSWSQWKSSSGEGKSWSIDKSQEKPLIAACQTRTATIKVKDVGGTSKSRKSRIRSSNKKTEISKRVGGKTGKREKGVTKETCSRVEETNCREEIADWRTEEDEGHRKSANAGNVPGAEGIAGEDQAGENQGAARTQCPRQIHSRIGK